MKHLALVSFTSAALFGAAFAQDSKQLQPVALTVGKTSIDLQVPAAWGKSERISSEIDDESAPAVPVIDYTMKYEGVAFRGLVPKGPYSDDLPALTISLAKIPSVFQDDREALAPEGERPPGVFTAEQKPAILAPLEEIYKASAVDVEKFRGPEMEPIPGVEGAWWGGLVGVLDILDIQYIENADKTLRGVSFLYTEGGDINFSVSLRIVLYSPSAKAIVFYECPFYTFPEIEKFQEAVGKAGEGPAVIQEYRKGLKYIRDRASWSGTKMGRLLEQLESAARSTILK